MYIHTGATTLGGMDFIKTESQLRLKKALDGKRVNCVLLNMAPNANGVKMIDQKNIINLCYAVLKLKAQQTGSTNVSIVEASDLRASIHSTASDIKKKKEKQIHPPFPSV
uniref:Ribosomal RNA methyltransferase FtsJ domain-containing protein n=1 Tax=Glossina austeni TaxID=7395 RepID=A0A1A9V1D7_GLOAU